MKFLFTVPFMAITLTGCLNTEYEPPPIESRIEAYEHTLNDGTRCVRLTLGYTDGFGVDCDFKEE